MNAAPSYAAFKPERAPSDSNLNAQSTRPIELERDPDFELPDIADVFEGYSIDELPDDIPTSASPNIPINDDGLLILELRIGRAILNDAFIGYSTRNTLMVPLGGLADALQLPIRIDPLIGQAEGWFPDEDRSFKLDTKRHLVTIAGKVENVDTSSIDVRDDDIYVNSDLLSQWLLIDFDFSFAEQMLTVAAQDGVELPIERLAKLQLNREALRLRPSDAALDYPIMRAPYTLGTLPFADINVTHDYDEQTTPHSRTRGSILSHSDLLYMNQSSFISYSEEEGLQDVRFTLSRTDPMGKLFYGDDPLSNTWLAKQANDAGITNLEIGDIFSTQLPLTMLNQDGRGIVISNQPLDRSDQYDRTTINGDVQPDWEVELYRNEELLAFQRSSSTGRYEFNDVPLIGGLNLFRLVFYGPFGETREEVKRVLVNQNIAKKGQSYFQFIAMEQGRSLVDTDNNQSVNFSSSLFNGIGAGTSLNTRGKERLAIEYEYGLADQLALYLQGAHVPITSDTETNAATVGLAGVWKDIYGRLDLSRSDDNGNAAELTLQTNLSGINLSLRHQQFDNYLSDYTEDPTDPVTQRSVLRADGSFKPWALPRLSIGFAGAHTEFDSGRKRSELNQRTTTQLFGRASLNHNLTFTHDDTPGSTTGPSELTRGNLLVSVPVFGAYIRGGANYNITPDTELQGASLTADYSVTQDMLVRGEIFRQFSPNKNTYQASVSHRFSRFSIGANAGATSNGELIAGLSLNTAIGFEPRTGEFRSYGDAVSRQGIISARSFVDSNNNGLFDLDEETLENADYLVRNGAGNARSQDAVGGAKLVKYIAPHEAVPVSINPPSLEDPFLVAGDSSVRAVTRPGTPMVIDFPIKPAADVEGSVTLEQRGELKEASNVLIEALDTEGNVVRSARSAFDGIYMMELLPIGTYSLRVSPEQADRLGFTTGEPIELEVTDEDEYIQEVDFNIAR